MHHPSRCISRIPYQEHNLPDFFKAGVAVLPSTLRFFFSVDPLFS
jgi:hypothetical protein